MNRNKKPSYRFWEFTLLSLQNIRHREIASRLQAFSLLTNLTYSFKNNTPLFHAVMAKLSSHTVGATALATLAIRTSSILLTRDHFKKCCSRHNQYCPERNISMTNLPVFFPNSSLIFLSNIINCSPNHNHKKLFLLMSVTFIHC